MSPLRADSRRYYHSPGRFGFSVIMMCCRPCLLIQWVGEVPSYEMSVSTRWLECWVSYVVGSWRSLGGVSLGPPIPGEHSWGKGNGGDRISVGGWAGGDVCISGCDVGSNCIAFSRMSWSNFMVPNDVMVGLVEFFSVIRSSKTPLIPLLVSC